MANHIHVQKVPRAALVAAAVLIAGTIGLASRSRAARLAEHPAIVPPTDSADVRFEDRPDGTLAVLDAHDGHLVTSVQGGPNGNGFVRGVMRGMFRTRKLESLGHDGVFRIAQEANGHLTLTDLETQRRVELESFGPTNAATFGAILTASHAPAAPAAGASR